MTEDRPLESFRDKFANLYLRLDNEVHIVGDGCGKSNCRCAIKNGENVCYHDTLDGNHEILECTEG